MPEINKEFAQLIFQLVPSAIFTVDNERKVTSFNKKAEQITGYKAEEVIGNNCFLFALEPCINQCNLFLENIDKPIINKECTIKRKDGEIRTISKNADILKDENGTIIGAIESFEDITGRKSMEAELKTANDELEIQTWGLEKTNKAIKALYKDLEKKNIELMRLDKLKSDFVSVVSHELRTPLAISIEGINLILDGIVGDVSEKQKKLLTTSHDNLVRLNTIINDLLDIQKIEAGKVTIKQGLIDFKALVTRIADDYKKVLARREQTLNLQLPEQEIFLYIDHDKIIQVITNLLNNAHKFTPEGGSIEIQVTDQVEFVLCSVKDTGIGLSEDNLKKLFQKFQQFGRTDGPGLKGTGLGLSISKALVEIHHGKIWAESALEKGTTFYFTLPKFAYSRKNFDEQIEKMVAPAASKGHAIALVTMQITNHKNLMDNYGTDVYLRTINSLFYSFSDIITRQDDISMLYDNHTVCFLLPKTDAEGSKSIIIKLKEKIAKSRLPLKDSNELDIKFGCALYPVDTTDHKELIPKAISEGTRTKKVLIVDDHPQIIRMLSARLQTSDFITEGVNDGEEALIKIKSFVPDLIILDIMMTKMNGYELWGKLKEDPLTANIPVIILTAKKTSDVLSEYKGFGSIPIIEKTEGGSHLIGLIQKILS